MSTRLIVCVIAFVLALASAARAEDGCPQGTFSVVNTPDGTSLTILFDAFTLSSDGTGGTQVKECDLRVPLNLPEGQSLGVYRVDYRGFAHLERRQSSELTVDYNLGPKNNGRRFHRKTKGEYDGDFLFTENIGAGLMKRVGCGEAAVLDVSITLALVTDAAGEAMTTLDSADGAARGGLIYYFDTRKCRG